MNTLKSEFSNLIWFCRTFPFIALCLAVGGSVVGLAIGYGAGVAARQLGWLAARAAFACFA